VTNKPNIVYILADDLGYGDVSCLNAEGKIPTPNLDRLAADGMRFTDAHATSSICTPSRYSILTGRYNWRSRLQAWIVGTFEEPLIDRDRLTVAGFLKQNGYNTACVGKWHLGLGWGIERTEDFIPDAVRDAFHPATDKQKALWQETFSRPITDGPITLGFDTYFGVDVPNWPPYCFIEDDRTVGIPSEFLPAHHLEGGMQASVQGPAIEGWTFEPILPALAERAERVIAEQAGEDNPFFLYMPLTSPHTPLAVNDEWKGKSELNLYADFVMETDAVVGRVLDALEDHGVADNTIVMFASDNGCAHCIGVPDLEARGHFPSAQYRGYKSDAWDGGHRIPYIVRWPGVTAPGSECDRTVCLSDLVATCADILDRDLPENAGEDSVSLLPLLKGDDVAVREYVVHHSGHGKFAIRNGKWKLVLCPGSGGWTDPTDDVASEQGLPPVQLYDMQTDPGEQVNLQAERPDIVTHLLATLVNQVDRGRSTPGPNHSNDVPVDIWKGPAWLPPADA